jgi:peptide-methionine (R)-S-oxide reductase
MEGDKMQRRHFLGLAGLSLAAPASMWGRTMTTTNDKIETLDLPDDEWRQILEPQRYEILRKEGTERAFTSDLNDEKGEGTFICSGCNLPLFESSTKFDSGTGWPSFFDIIEGHLGTSRDFKLIYPRTEYHCNRCGGHQGHIFKDGPKPTGLRYCNNGSSRATRWSSSW